MTDLDKRLADMRGRSEQATEGPWYLSGDSIYSPEHMQIAETWEQNDADGDIDREVPTPDAEFIAHARTDLDDLRGAVEDVLALHTWGEQWNCCRECGFEWPCRTLRAITARLEG